MSAFLSEWVCVYDFMFVASRIDQIIATQSVESDNLYTGIFEIPVHPKNVFYYHYLIVMFEFHCAELCTDDVF